jgi:hypothetical protein
LDAAAEPPVAKSMTAGRMLQMWYTALTPVSHPEFLRQFVPRTNFLLCKSLIPLQKSWSAGVSPALQSTPAKLLFSQQKRA